MPLDNNTYYPAKSITIYPSSNAVDNGKIQLEKNLRNVTINITDLNYVISPNPGGYDISLVNDKINIASGKALINGFEVSTTTEIQYRLPTADEIYTGEKYKTKYEGFALLCLHTLFDSLENLSGNVQVGDTWYCEGIQICYPTAEEFEAHENEYLLLGGVKEDGTIKENDEKFNRIDAKYILVKIKPDPETGAPPEQSTNLLEFINNYLKGYWLSKAGDNEYGSITFRSMPDKYLEPEFDFNTEPSLKDEQYALRIDKVTSDSIQYGYINLKERNTEGTTEKSTLIRPLNIVFKGEYKDDADNYDASIQYNTQTQSLDFITDQNSKIFNFKNNQIPTQYLTIEYGQSLQVYTKDKDVKNYLIDQMGDIATVSDDKTRFVTLSAIDSSINFGKNNQTGKIVIKDKVSDNWENVLNAKNNMEFDKNIYARGYIIAGNAGNDPSEIQVPDFAKIGGMRNVKSGDIWAEQVWSAVYNDIAEMFDFSDAIVGKDVIGLIVAQDSKNLDKFTVASKQNNNIIGIVSENPGICTGGIGCKNGLPVALAGRVKVRFEGKMPKPGQYVGLSKKTPGYASICKYNYKYRCGKVLKVLPNNYVEILVVL